MPLPWSSWAILHRNRVVVLTDEIITQIRATPTDTLGWFEPTLYNAWKNLFPITPMSIRTRDLPLEHPAWSQTPWWKFITDTPLVSWEETEILSWQRRPSIAPHFDELGWIIQEQRKMDLRGSASTYMGNHPMLKLIQILVLVKSCDLLICCRKDTMGILKYLMVWKPEWNSSKDLLRRLGWTMVDATMMNPNPNPVEIPLSQFVTMNILMWNCRGALNPNFK